MDDRYLYAGLIRLHLLHHAVKEPIYGLAMIEELGRHGYKLSAGTLYPILHGLEQRGYLSSTEERTGSAARRVYRATPAGVRASRSGQTQGARIVRRAVRGRYRQELKQRGMRGAVIDGLGATAANAG